MHKKPRSKRNHARRTPEHNQARAVMAKHLRDARATVKTAGNYFAKVHDMMYIVRDLKHRGLATHVYSITQRRIVSEDIAAA